jgi:subtilisin family serine protease
VNESEVSRKRYVVLPNQGIVGKVMEAAVFLERDAERPMRQLSAQVDELRSAATGALIAVTLDMAERPALHSGEYHVLSHRFGDGPALVSMSEDARWALEAAHPGLRVVEVTRYHLPSLVPRNRPGAVRAAGLTRPAGQSAVLDNGRVFLDDDKQRIVAQWPTNSSNEGAGVMVGLLDTGVDSTHPALAHAVLTERCIVAGAALSVKGPVNWGEADSARAGHGTHVAGIICAAPGFGGPQGMAPKAQVASYRVFPDNPTGAKPAENYDVIDAIRSAIEDGCHIVNLSIEGAGLKEDGVRSAISDAWRQGVVCIAAAGNGWGLPVSYPAALPLCIAVTACGRIGAFPPLPSFERLVSNERSMVDPDVFLAAFSNFGPRVQFMAPGHAIVSTFPRGQWWIESGTSMAAPFVAGLLARILSDTPEILGMYGDEKRSAAMTQLLVARARLMRMPQRSYEGWGLPA